MVTRKIVVMQPHEWLEAAASMGDFAVAAPELVARTPAGVEFLETPPVAVEDRFVLAVDVDETGEAALLDQDDVDATFADPVIEPFPIVSPGAAVGDIAAVRKALNLTDLTDANNKGRGVRIAVVDTGIDGTQVNVSGGWSPWPGIAPATAQPGHGTMCAVDARIAAPEAQIYDYPLLARHNGTSVAFLSDAIRFFAEIMTTILQMPGPMVVTNSWGIFDRKSDAPTGNPQNYSANATHPFNLITTALVATGADVLFAAGNCGEQSPDARCGPGDIGPGNSIHGANSHPAVITVGAVTVTGDLLGYSSQGPGSLRKKKPDISGFSHFEVPGVDPPLHTGTSAACPVVAGVVAAIRSKASARDLSPAKLKRNLLDSAAPPADGRTGWTRDYGHGLVDANAAWDRL